MFHHLNVNNNNIGQIILQEYQIFQSVSSNLIDISEASEHAWLLAEDCLQN